MKKIKKFACILIMVLLASFLAAEDIVLESDALKLVLHEQTGSFTLYRKTGKKGSLLALNDISGSSSSTFFAIKTDSVSRVLRRAYDVTVKCAKNPDGSASLMWEVAGMISAEARFTLIPAVTEMPEDTVRVDIIVMNLQEKDLVCSVKAVIDTVLGESSRIHFTTARGTAIRSEKEYTSMVQDKWISSSNGTETASFVFAGSNATNPDYVLAASRDTLISDIWKPVANEGRAFDSFQSPNNSAIGVWYENVKLRFFETLKRTFFITTATDGDITPVSVLVGSVSEPAVTLEDKSTAEIATQIVDAAVEEAVYKALSEDLDTNTVDYDYVQSLLDRIEEIEASDNVDPEEISRLNTEIDALILELIR